MDTIYWFKDYGLFTGNPKDIDCASSTEVEHKCDAIIKDYKITKNRYGGLCKITREGITSLNVMNLDQQYEFFKSL